MKANSIAEQSAYNMGYEAGMNDTHLKNLKNEDYKAGYLKALDDMKLYLAQTYGKGDK
jgi:hypothetical protein